jgi:hypothetical protein
LCRVAVFQVLQHCSNESWYESTSFTYYRKLLEELHGYTHGFLDEHCHEAKLNMQQMPTFQFGNYNNAVNVAD